MADATASISHWMKECDKYLFFCMHCTAANTKTSSLCISCGCQLQMTQNQELMHDGPNGHPKEKTHRKIRQNNRY